MHLVYVDQNLVGQIANGATSIPTEPGGLLVYSDVHFEEISRSSTPEKYLAALEKVGAAYLRLELTESFKITDKASLAREGSAFEHFHRYSSAMADTPFDLDTFSYLLAWVNGGGSRDALLQLPASLRSEFESLIARLPEQYASIVKKMHDVSAPAFESAINQLSSGSNDIQGRRSTFGTDKGRLDNIKGPNVLMQVWKHVTERCGHIEPDRFFGFDPLDKQGYENFPQYLGIVGCCGMLDVLGFEAERKSRKIDKVANVQSDARHIAMGAFCSSILSTDGKLIRRARAIYEYRGISTSVRLVPLDG